MPLIGYARVSTEDQTPLPQSQALKSAGCAEIHEEQASGGNRARPVLARVLERIGKGDTLVVVRIDRLARSLSHLLEVIERLEAKGAFFRSLMDPIDTSSPQGKFTLQVLGAAAEFERALIRERTKAGLASARTKGRVGGNPGLRARDPAALRKVRLARQDGYMERLNETAQDWVPQVRRLRPDMAWEDVLRIINGPLPESRRWTQSRLLRAVNAYVRDGFLPEAVQARAARLEIDDARHRRSHQGRGSRNHPSGHLQPVGGDARANTPWADKLAAVVGQDAVGTSGEAGVAGEVTVSGPERCDAGNLSHWAPAKRVAVQYTNGSDLRARALLAKDWHPRGKSACTDHGQICG